MGKNNTKAEKAKRNQAYAALHKKKSASARRFGRPAPSPAAPGAPSTGPSGMSSSPSVARTMYPAVCSSCGVETTVPFEPISGKPVQCRSCFQPKPRI